MYMTVPGVQTELTHTSVGLKIASFACLHRFTAFAPF